VMVLLGATILLALILGPMRRLIDPIATKLTNPIAPIALLLGALGLGGILAFAFTPNAAATGGSKGIAAGLESKPNVILVMVDTLRADHLSCMGGEWVETPNLCRIAADGVQRRVRQFAQEAFARLCHGNWVVVIRE